MNQHCLSAYLNVSLWCVLFAGCGRAELTAQINKQASEIEKLQRQLQDADGRLEIASKQLESAGEHAERLEGALAAATKAASTHEQRAAADIALLQKKCDQNARALAAAENRLAEIDREQRQEATKLNAVGVWVRAGEPACRFIFLENKTGVFQYWDAKKKAWQEGDKKEPGEWAGEGKFIYRHSSANGLYELRFERKRSVMSPVDPLVELEKAKREKSLGIRLPPSITFREESKLVEATFVMKAADEARIVGWQAADTVLRRVDEDWIPEPTVK